MVIDIRFCNTCGGELGTDECLHQTLKNRKFGATLDDKDNVLQECCEDCAQELMEEIEET